MLNFSAASLIIPGIISVQVYSVVLNHLAEPLTILIYHHLINFRCFSLPSSNHRAKVFYPPLIVHTGTARIFLFCWVFAITKHCSKVRLLECAGVLLMCLPSFPQTFHYAYSSQAWNFQMKTYTTVPSINKQYIISGKWKCSPRPLQGFCSWVFARKIVSHLFLPSGLNLLAIGLTSALFMSAFLTLQTFNETL